jgi:hypothetical protein
MSTRARVWTFISYPESMDSNWLTQIEETCIPWVISPIHDLDLIDQSDKEKGFKKPHYHHMIMFSQVKSYKQVQEIIKFLNCPLKVDQVHSVGAMVRYFIHADHKKKTQYDPKNIQALNGADLNNLWQKNDSEIFSKINYFLSIISDNDIQEFATFIDFVREHKPEDFFLVLQNQYFIANYIKSIRFKSMGNINPD